MLAQATTIRDISRALPALVSDPDVDVPVSIELLDVHATGLRERYDGLLPVIDRAGNTLTEALKKLAPEEVADPDGEGARALERGEAYFKRCREELRRLRCAFVDVGAAPSHQVFDALDRLDNLYAWIIATMQEVRWSVLILDGVRDTARCPKRRSYTSSSEWLASLHDE